MAQYIRFRIDSDISYGILEGNTARAVHGDLFQNHEPSDWTVPLSDVELLYPCQPGKILAVGRNYRSHLGNRPQPTNPEIFYKPVTALQDPGGPIRIPRDATDLHYEGEMVIVIGKPVKNASPEEAARAIFGVTCGNDVSERNWQSGPGKDLQWWRAKGCDTFAPLGPVIDTDADYSNLLLRTRLNGEVVQEQTTADLLFDCPEIISWVSNWVTLLPGDVIYTGTPGATRKLSAGDVVEVELEGVGLLRNPVLAG